MKKPLIASLLVFGMLLTTLAGCGSTGTTAPSQSEAAAETTAAASTDASAAVTAAATEETSAEPTVTAEKATYPLCDPGAETLSLWVEFPGFLSMNGALNTFADHDAFKEAEKETGVHIAFTEVSMMTKSEQFTLMCAAQNMTDMMAGGISIYPGGSLAAIEDDIYIDMAPYAAQYMGNYMELLGKNPAYQELAYNDKGEMAEIISIADEHYVTSGPQMRQDWLDALNLDIPETYDELHDVLTAFKNTYNCDTPFLLLGQTQQPSGGFVGGYGTLGAAEITSSSTNAVNMYVGTDGKIHNGFRDDSYEDYLKMMNQWYNEGLIYSDFFSQSSDPMAGNSDALILNGNTGFWYAQSNFIGDYESKATTKGFKIVGIPEPELNQGDKWHFASQTGSGSGGGIGVSTNCKDPVLAAKWLDYWFTDAGIMLSNYGIEGESYTMVNGEPEFTDLLTNSPEGLIFQFALSKYTLSVVPSYSHTTRTWGTYSEGTIDAIHMWTENSDSACALPDALTLNTEENEEYSKLFADITTYTSENIVKFVNGDRPFDEWQSFQDDLTKMQLDRCTELYQEAYDRYLTRDIQ